VYLDGALQGRAGSQGELRVQAKPGEHTLKVSLKGMLDFQRTVTLTSPEAPRLDAHLESRPPEEQPSEEARQAEAAVTEARAKLQQAEATLELNKATYERDENLFRAGLMTAQERDAAEQAYHGSQANVRALQDQVRVAEAQLAVAQANGKNVRVNPKDGLKYVWIPPGTFMMGCSPGDNVCSDKEKPAHQVAITRGFWMGQTPVTVGAYKRFARAAGRSMPEAPRFNMDWANENMPIVNLTWDDAHAYCEWMGGRLPTEAEWEYAARGGSTEARYGNLDEIAWYDRNSGNQTHDVGQKRANGFGLYDVLGNVWEWVNDWYDENYYQRSPSQDPQGPSGGQFRVLRGGSWNISASGDVRVSYRVWGNPTVRVSGGFRCSGEVGSP
jgi:formylglycine-generating enzyme required for sulfatase activity